jgi:hypothetical protein
MKDFLGNTLKVGDIILYTVFSDLQIGYYLGTTGSRAAIKITYEVKRFGTIESNRFSYQRSLSSECLEFHNCYKYVYFKNSYSIFKLNDEKTILNYPFKGVDYYLSKQKFIEYENKKR